MQNKRPKVGPRHIEDEHQERLFSWARHYPIRVNDQFRSVADFMFAIPNGGKRGKFEAARLKAQGVKAGVSDVLLSLPCRDYHGLYIELKRPIVKGQSKPAVSAEQKAFMADANSVGYLAVVAYGFEQARLFIKDYLHG